MNLGLGVAMDEKKKYALFLKQKAEEALSSHDLVEAKTFLNIAKLLFSNLDGVEQMLAVVDVHIAAQQKMGGNEMDWYAILQVDPSADVNIIKEQHRKLALTLYPDTNKNVEEAALGLIGKAWAQAALELIAKAVGILSDKGKRALYDMKRLTFWTLCPSCKIRHHLPRVYENCELPCPSCGVGFVARDSNVDDGINAMGNGGPSNSSNVGAFQTHETASNDTDGSVEFVCEMTNSSRADKGCDSAGKRRENEAQKQTKKNEKGKEAKLQQEKQKSRKRPKRSKDEIENDGEEHVYGELSTEVTFSSQPRRSNERTQHVSSIYPVSSICPDKSLDIYDFGADRVEVSFKQGQIWATYDYDGMPRRYCQIKSIHSVKPFVVLVKWLDSCCPAQMEMWWKAGLCSQLPFGEFVLSSSTYTCRVPIREFSHVMESIEGSLTIYPQQGQVWALYRDWMPHWSALNRNEIYLKKQKYETVLVVTGFSEQKGLKVVSLHKLPCYAVLFQKINESVRDIPVEEIYRFSHMIPAHRLKEDEIADMPKECWVLDPAALLRG